MFQEKVKVLLFEDNPGDVLLIREMFKEEVASRLELTQVARLADGIKLLSEQGFDAVLLDLNLPDSIGIATARMLKQNAPNLPIVILTSLADESIALEAIQLGMEDYLVKGQITAALLAHALRYAIERKRVEKVLRESEAKYRLLVEQSLLGIFIIQDGRIVYVNRVIAEKIGYSIDEAISLSTEQLQKLIHPDDRDLVWNRMFSRLSGNPEMASYECRFVVRSGSIYWVDMNTSVIEYLGKPAIQIFIVDITERKRAEEALHNSEERFRSLVEKSSDVMIIIDRDLIITYVSPTVRTIFNRDPFELLGKSAFDFATEFLHQDDVEAVIKAFAGCLERPGAEKQVECRFRLLDGSWLNLETIGKNQLDNPSIQGLVVTIRDITERKRAEKKIQSQLDELKRWQDVMLGREDRVQELKREVNEICRRMGEAMRYKSQENAPADPGAGIKEHK